MNQKPHTIQFQRHIWLSIFVLSVFLCHSAKAQAPEQDCLNAIHVCTDTYVQNSAFSGAGSINDIPAGSSCLQNGEVNSVWYTFTALSAGQLTVQLVPLNPNDDYDFAIYNLSADSCGGIVNGTVSPARCNYSNTPGATGLAAGFVQTSAGTSDPNQCAPITAVVGEIFAMVVSNFTNSQTGYQLNFGGSASVVDVQSPQMTSVDLNNACSPDRVYVYFNELIDCSSIASDGSDFTETIPGGEWITNVLPVNCVDGLTNSVRVLFNTNLSATGNHTLQTAIGSDGNSILDRCGNEIQVGSSINFQVNNLDPVLNLVSIADADCGIENGAATAGATGGTAPYQYEWQTNPFQSGPSVNDLPTGFWTCVVTDANGCSDEVTAAIGNNGGANVSTQFVADVSCNGLSDGYVELDVTGNGPFQIDWLNYPAYENMTNVSGLSAGTYVLQITDANNCLVEHVVNVSQPPVLILPQTVTNPDCAQANGSMTLNVIGGTGPYSFDWSHDAGNDSANAFNLIAGVYNVSVIDQNGCTGGTQGVLVDNFAPNATIGESTPDCGQNSGSATVLPTNGTPPYTFLWNDPLNQATQTATGLVEGDYFVNITDAGGCVQIINVKIDTVPEPISSVLTTIASCGINDGTANITVSGGVMPYTFNWTPGIPMPTGQVNDLYADQYSVVIVDSIGCETSVNFEIEELDPVSDISVLDDCITETFAFQHTTDAAPISTIWHFGDGTMSDIANPTHTYSSPGSYDVELQLLGGCKNDTVRQTVNVFPLPEPSFTVTPEFVTTRTDAQFEYTGTQGQSFSWDLGNEIWSSAENPIAEYPIEGFYSITLTVVDANGCVQTITDELEVNLAPAMFFPNAFTPNGTLANSRFRATGVGVTEIVFSIFDRWGSEVYSSTDLAQSFNEGWDGTLKGGQAPQGTYAYFVEAKFYDGSEYQANGTVILIR